MPYVYSTSTCDIEYCDYKRNNNIVVKTKGIVIKGGANKAHFGDMMRLYTPKGVATKVTDDELQFLEKNEHFLLDKKNGFIKVEKKREDIEKAVKDMSSKDLSAPRVESDFGYTGAKEHAL